MCNTNNILNQNPFIEFVQNDWINNILSKYINGMLHADMDAGKYMSLALLWLTVDRIFLWLFNFYFFYLFWNAYFVNAIHLSMMTQYVF